MTQFIVGSTFVVCASFIFIYFAEKAHKRRMAAADKKAKLMEQAARQKTEADKPRTIYMPDASNPDVKIIENESNKEPDLYLGKIYFNNTLGKTVLIEEKTLIVGWENGKTIIVHRMPSTLALLEKLGYEEVGEL